MFQEMPDVTKVETELDIDVLDSEVSGNGHREITPKA